MKRLLSSGSLWAKLIDRFSRIGEEPLCNGKTDRTFKIFDYYFILCYRCTFIVIGSILGLVMLLTFLKKARFLKRGWFYKLLIACGLILPTTIDGVLQYFYGIESTNFRRSWTGFLAGLGFSIGVHIIMTWLDALFLIVKKNKQVDI